MKKNKFLLVTFLVLIMAACCAMFVACGGEKVKLTWTLDDGVKSVVVENYKELPTEVKKDAEFNFTIELNAGYELDSVSNAKKVEGYTYKLTPSKETTITIKTKKIVTSISVTDENEDGYIAGDTVDLSKITVTATYEVGEPGVVTSGISVKYQNGDTFIAGDTKYTVTYSGKSFDVTVPTVLGVVTLNLNGGEFSDDDLTILSGLTNYNYDTAKGIVTFTFDKALESDIVLPSPQQFLEAGNAESELPFSEWQGVTNDTIPAGTEVSVTITASYESALVEFKSLSLVLENGVPYLVINGEFKAAKSAYLYLFEGNKNIELKGDEVTRGTDKSFTLKFDLRKLTSATYDETDKDGNVTTGNHYEGSWMDIKFQTVNGDKISTQEIDLNNYSSDFIVGSRSIGAVIDGEWYTFEYQYWTPAAGDAIKGEPGTYYKGTENLLKINYSHSTEIPDYLISGVTLEERDGKPYLIITGECIGIDTKAAAEEVLDGYIGDMQDFSNWGNIDITGKQTLTVNDNLTFEIALCIDNIVSAGSYIMHTSDGGNFDPADFDRTTTITIGEYIYSITEKDIYNWGWAWTCIECESNKKATADPVSVKVEGDKVYFVITGTSENWTEADFKAALSLDFENGEDGSDKTVIDADKITVTIDEDGKFEVKADITDLKTGIFWVHLTGVLSGAGDVGNSAGTEPVTCNGNSYSYADHTFSWGPSKVFHVTAAE